MHRDMCMSMDDVMFYLNLAKNDICLNRGKSLKSLVFNEDLYDAYNKSYDPPFEIVVGVKLLYESDKQGFVEPMDFVKTVALMYHESRHDPHKLAFHDASMQHDPYVQRMARDSIIADSFREFYLPQTGYFYNLAEIDAELYGIRSAERFLNTYVPEIDGKKYLLDMTREYSGCYLVGYCRDYDDVIRSFERAKADALDRYVPMRFMDGGIGRKRSNAYRLFSRDYEKVQAYYDCRIETSVDGVYSGGLAAKQLLYDFVKEHESWRFYHYECLKNEWPESALSGKAKPPVFAKRRRLDGRSRVDMLDDKFGDIVRAYDMLHDCGTQDQYD